MSEVCEQYRQRGDRLRERRTRPRSGSAQEAFGKRRLGTSSLRFFCVNINIHALCYCLMLHRAIQGARRLLELTP